MAMPEHLKIIKKGVSAWNEWRHSSPEIVPDLSEADLRGITLRSVHLGATNLKGANLSNAYLYDSYLSKANLTGAVLNNVNLHSADLREACFIGAKLREANLIRANLNKSNISDADLRNARLAAAELIGANLTKTNLSRTDLSGANLSHAVLNETQFSDANLSHVNFNSADLTGADFYNAAIGSTLFCNIDLSLARHLDTVRPLSPSTVGVDTLYKSRGNIPRTFLLACDLPDGFITYVPSLVASHQPIAFHSCFISYSNKDETFAHRLYSHMRSANLRVWFAPEDIKGGQKLHEQVFSAIRFHDRLLLVLSEHSLSSKWVANEIRRARKVECEQGHRKLFPIRLVDYEVLEKWECFDSITGEDLAEEVRSYFIPDFSNWNNHEELEQAFARLLSDLKVGA